MQSRKEMEAEADRIGVPWTHTTTDDELHSMLCAHRDRLQGEDQMSDQAEAPEVQEEEQQCHGLYWDYPKAPECKICTGQESCYHRFTQVTFPEMLKAAGPEATIEQLATALDVSQEAVLVAKNEVQKVYPIVPEAKTQDADKSGNGRLVQNENPMDFVDADELEDVSVQSEDPGESLELPAKAEIEPDAEIKAEPEPIPETKMPVDKKASSKSSKKKASSKSSKKKASSKASSKKKGAKKASSKKAPPEEVIAQEETEAQDPSPAESVKTAKAPAGTEASMQNASDAKEQADPVATTDPKSRKRRPNKKPTRPPKLEDGRLADPWGKHTWKKRWARERKGKYIKQLRPGMKLTRNYKGTLYEVVVLKKYYRYNNREYPTLYSVVKEITGTKTSLRQPDEKGRRPEGTRQLCNWNAVRFFSLKALFSKL